jgi:hypothetical protein
MAKVKTGGEIEGQPMIAIYVDRDEADVIHSLLGRCYAGGPTSPIWEPLHEALYPDKDVWTNAVYEVNYMINAKELGRCGTIKLTKT